MLPERRARRDANTAITDLIGSGLFRFKREEWIPGAKVVYERFEGSVPRSEPARQA
jgi:peptide/nickel transport system substrate-binding protein